MKPRQPVLNSSDAFSCAARRRILSCRFEPLFLAAWERVLMIHFEVDPAVLQRSVPFELDLHDGRAFVSLVAFTLRGMRLCFGGRFAAWLFRPIATHDFLNVRTYVRQGSECGIHFLAEWLSNRLATLIGPGTFSLPYRFGHIQYDHDPERGRLHGEVIDAGTGSSLRYAGTVDADRLEPCPAGSLDEWLMERYTAFNSAGDRRRFFRVWHPPWRQCRVQPDQLETSMLVERWPWFKGARPVGANFSPGFPEVWMGRPHRTGPAPLLSPAD